MPRQSLSAPSGACNPSIARARIPRAATRIEVDNLSIHAVAPNGTAGNDRLSGGNGADSFVFSRGDGTSTITDFSSLDNDKVDVTKFGFANWAELQPSLTASFGGNTKLALDSNTFVYFDDVRFDDFVATDFIL